MTQLATPDFLTAFQSRQACCRALLELSRQQATMIAADDYAELSEILHSKQALIEHLGRLTSEQQAHKLAWPQARQKLPAADRTQCEAILADIEVLLAELLDAEQSSSRTLVSRRDSTQRELQALSAGAQTQEAYDLRSQPILSRFDVNL